LLLPLPPGKAFLGQTNVIMRSAREKWTPFPCGAFVNTPSGQLKIGMAPIDHSPVPSNNSPGGALS
jgi:hypothetical protein